MNPGGIRADLDSGPITHGEAFGVQPFNGIVTTKTLTGAQIKTVLEQQFAINSLANPGAVGATARQNLSSSKCPMASRARGPRRRRWQQGQRHPPNGTPIDPLAPTASR